MYPGLLQYNAISIQALAWHGSALSLEGAHLVMLTMSSLERANYTASLSAKNLSWSPWSTTFLEVYSRQAAGQNGYQGQDGS
eukprot:m.271883 g.271883  ORF g.271883 m.271883 type:complete len:82 (-) comp17673_c0_seq18:988-1233(-)